MFFFQGAFSVLKVFYFGNRKRNTATASAKPHETPGATSKPISHFFDLAPKLRERGAIINLKTKIKILSQTWKSCCAWS